MHDVSSRNAGKWRTLDGRFGNGAVLPSGLRSSGDGKWIMSRYTRRYLRYLPSTSSRGFLGRASCCTSVKPRAAVARILSIRSAKSLIRYTRVTW